MDGRFSSILSLKHYECLNEPLLVGTVSAVPPKQDQMILRMLVRSPYSNGLQLPPELNWLKSAIYQAENFQDGCIWIRHPFTYVTVRHGTVNTITDYEWHVDGFSAKYNHLPEANYVFVLGPHGSYGTEYTTQTFKFPNDFNPLKHNIHSFFQKRIDFAKVRTTRPGFMYFIDPYVVHRRPPGVVGLQRTFVRISFTPIEIPDVNNTPNPLIKTAHYVNDGVKDFRDSLVDYDIP